MKNSKARILLGAALGLVGLGAQLALVLGVLFRIAGIENAAFWVIQGVVYGLIFYGALNLGVSGVDEWRRSKK